MNLFTRLLCASAVVLAAAGCDKDYDLANIDSTVRIAVNDLVIPINIDEITLDDVIEANDEVQIVDGAYAYVNYGHFDSDPESFDPISAHVDNLNPNTLRLASNGSSLVYHVDIPALSDYDFKGEDVNESVEDVTRIYGDVQLTITLSLASLAADYAAMEVTGAKLQLPPMCDISRASHQGSYDSASGVFTLDPFTINPIKDLALTIEAASVGVASGSIVDRTFSASGQIGLFEGNFKLDPNGASAPAYMPIDIDVAYSMPDFTITAIDGSIHYDIEGFDIPRIEINDLPDFLAQEGTDLRLANPMLYMQVTNPLRHQGVYATAGMELEAMRDYEPGHIVAIDEPSFFIGKGDPMMGEYYNYCLSPVAPANIDAEYAGAEHIKFSQLGTLLSGNGMPSAIDVRLVNPMLPSQTVTRFPLKSFDGIIGHYKLVAPFQLEGGSVIVYGKTDKDWDSEDLEKLTITTMEISLTATTDVPMEINLTAYPLDKQGLRIPGVSVTGAKVPAMAKGEQVKIVVECPDAGFSGLDGIEYTASATAADGAQALNPDMTIVLSNVRPKVGGYYETNLD